MPPGINILDLLTKMKYNSSLKIIIDTEGNMFKKFETNRIFPNQHAAPLNSNDKYTSFRSQLKTLNENFSKSKFTNKNDNYNTFD